MLADYYAGEGMLISLEEPLWPQRESTLEDRFSHRDGDPPSVDAPAFE